MFHFARLRLQQQLLSPKPTHNYFVTPQCITDSRSQRLQLPGDLHKAKISLTHHCRKYKIPPNRPTPCHPLFQFTTDSRLSCDRRKYKIPQKSQAYQKSCQKMSVGFPIKSHPIQKNTYIYTGIPISYRRKKETPICVIVRFYLHVSYFGKNSQDL